MKRAFIVDCYDDYEIRLKYVEEVLKQNYDEVTLILSNFNHLNKKHYTDFRKKSIYINVLKYKKNFSIMRIISHYRFALHVKTLCEKYSPDLIYCIVPPNSLVKFMTKYKQSHNCKLLFDVCDLWPETFPKLIKVKFIKYFFLKWANLRDNYLEQSNAVIFECNLFKECVYKQNKPMLSKVMYLCKAQQVKKILEPIQMSQINLLYLGSINNLIDISCIIKLLKIMNQYKKTVLHIIGDGEQKHELLRKLAGNKLEYQYYGMIFDNSEKKKIFNICHFGLNIMKPMVCVGLTMKSIDYFSFNLPIINNIGNDTFNIVKAYDVGLNLENNNYHKLAKTISKMDWSDLCRMKESVISTYETYFAEEYFKEELGRLLEEV